MAEYLCRFVIVDNVPWPVSSDGTGHSLVLSRMAGDPDEGTTWSASTLIGGTPGAPDQIQVEPEDPTLVTLVEIGHPGRYFEGTKGPRSFGVVAGGGVFLFFGP
jgi:hypothetical protein